MTTAEVLDGVPECRREWGGATGAMQRLRAPRRRRRRRRAAGRRSRRPAERARRRAAALQRRGRTRRVEQRVGLDRRALVRRRRRRSWRRRSRSPDVPGPALPGALRRPRRRARRAAPRRRARCSRRFAWRGSEGARDARRAGAPTSRCAITAREVTRTQSLGRHRRLHLPRPRATASDAPGYFVAGARSAAAARLRDAGGGRASRRRQRRDAAPRAAPTACAASRARPTRSTTRAGWCRRRCSRCCSRSSRCASRRARCTALYAERRQRSARARRGRRAGSRNRVVLDGAPVDVGFSIDLTIDPALQALAQKTAACYTGRHDVCRALGMRRAEDARPAARRAAARRRDGAHGRGRRRSTSPAAASRRSPARCRRARARRSTAPAATPRCDTRLPYPVQLPPRRAAQPGRLPRRDAGVDDQADHGRGVPLRPRRARQRAGSRAERAAMQRDGAPARDSLRGQLMRSDSARFLDRMFCVEQGFAACAPAVGRAGGGARVRLERRLRRRRATTAASATCCSAARSTRGDERGSRPRRRDDDRLRPPAERAGRPASSARRCACMPPASLDAGIVRRCAAGADGRRCSDDDWEKCRGGAVVDVVAEGWGQGHARASALGVAGMMATLAAAANGAGRRVRAAASGRRRARRRRARRRRRRSRRRRAGGAARARSRSLSRDAAEVILSGLSYSHRAGTARTACEQVFDARALPRHRLARRQDRHAELPERRPLARRAGAPVRAGRAARRAEARRGACSSLRPYKWYVAAYRADRAKRRTVDQGDRAC